MKNDKNKKQIKNYKKIFEQNLSFQACSAENYGKWKG